MTKTEELGRRVKEASRSLMTASSGDKNRALAAIADALWERRAEILAANAEDIAAARESGLREGIIDRLMLTEARMEGICDAVRKLIQLDDPVGVIERRIGFARCSVRSKTGFLLHPSLQISPIESNGQYYRETGC